MPKHKERKWIPYSADQMLSLVMAVETYPEFLPWCTGVTITARDKDGSQEHLTADLTVAFKMFREQFTSTVDCQHEKREINIAYIDGPFRYLNNRWRFEQNKDGSCTIDFFIDFEFRSLALQMLISAVFDKAVRKMISAFEARAHEIYGSASA